MPAPRRTPAFDDVDVPATAPVAPAPPPPAPPAAASSQVAVPEPPAQMSDSASQLASLLVGSDRTDTDGSVGGSAIPLSALLGGDRPVDPELDLVSIGPQIPRYLLSALRLAAFASGMQQRQLVTDGLKAILPPALVEQAYRMEVDRRAGR